ncbi:YybH family protein [Kineobactrum salinum]|uniref:SgcJ/EcaC family oxidoreductase n=1 Tax=Kineobactrum salinum TaxID=2708301 RepID=A0A6C0U2U1_9GAMM|nr:SgcJ/EcaC family oxidoreductase [Kineobactrum salinum]QIB65287.1 SgcJ/EcaC family oxidoreductase [Kineobactrum salinum]
MQKTLAKLWCNCTLALLLAAAPLALADDTEPVAALLEQLQSTWNAGDMDGYLALYRGDEELSLMFGNTVLRGRPAVRALFRKHYPDQEQMGRFAIDTLEVRLLSADVAIALGTFTHVFPRETINGGFSHVLGRAADGSWKIEHEHTSRGSVTPH